ncbi:hypothetical protein EDB87DRAFT_771185 [Lactarius vividus]|nr:hypothetical protein EDB87DRAFT_771185 [Lactarius vividus]
MSFFDAAEVPLSTRTPLVLVLDNVMDIPLATQCRGSNIPLDLMNMMGALLAGIAYGHVPNTFWRTFTFWLLLMAYGQHCATNKVDPTRVCHPTTKRQPKYIYRREHQQLDICYAKCLVLPYFRSITTVDLATCTPLSFVASDRFASTSPARHPGTTQNTNKLANWLVVYRTVSLSLGVIVTLSITARLIILS